VKRVLIVALVAACGGSKPRPAPAPPPPKPSYDPAELAELADGLYDVLETMAVVVEAHPSDCPGMAKELDQLFDKAAPIVTRAKEVANDRDASRALAAEMKRHDAQAPGLVDRISNGLAPCAGDPDVRNAIDKMPVF
jgi:predicted TIM-barrel fold metal-dependent hydrolase